MVYLAIIAASALTLVSAALAFVQWVALPSLKEIER